MDVCLTICGALTGVDEKTSATAMSTNSSPSWHRSSLKADSCCSSAMPNAASTAVPHNASGAVDEHERKLLFISIGATKLLPLSQAGFSQSLEYP